MDRTAAADEDLVRTLWSLHGSALLGYVTRLVDGDRQRAEDVVQETLLRAWRHPDNVRSAHEARPWLFTVARHLVVDGVRAARARPREVGDDALAVVPAAEELDRALEGWAVTEAMRSLSHEHRAVLLQTYFMGRSVAEAAEVLGVPAGTVKSRTYYALRALRLALQERGVTS
ncbi:MAG TPA: sigma-70 family RNA polymerase sigma factor [Motilibacteraceae bacterium]|nr:sigma-70 family RNA polymerase sigma factor [Motilibacteraceae bacterium]